MKSQTQERKVVTRRLVGPVRSASYRDNHRVVGSMGKVTEKMLATNEALAGGMKLTPAGRAGGYVGGHSGAVTTMNHPGIVALNQAAFDRAGISLDTLVEKIKRGMEAQKTVAVSVIKDEDGTIISSKLIREEDEAARHKFVTTAITMMGHLPQQEKLQLDIQARINQTTINVVNVTTGLEGLTGPELRAAYLERMRAVANGEVPKDLMIAPAKTLEQAIDQSRQIAGAEKPSVKGGVIVVDPVNGAVTDVITLRPVRTGDIAQTMQGAQDHIASKLTGKRRCLPRGRSARPKP